MRLRINKSKIQNCPTFNEIPRNRKIQVPLLTFLTQKKKKPFTTNPEKKNQKKKEAEFIFPLYNQSSSLLVIVSFTPMSI